MVDELGFDMNQGQSTSFSFALSSTSNETRQEELDRHRQGASSLSQTLTSPNQEQTWCR